MWDMLCLDVILLKANVQTLDYMAAIKDNGAQFMQWL